MKTTNDAPGAPARDLEKLAPAVVAELFRESRSSNESVASAARARLANATLSRVHLTDVRHYVAELSKDVSRLEARIGAHEACPSGLDAQGTQVRLDPERLADLQRDLRGYREEHSFFLRIVEKEEEAIRAREKLAGARVEAAERRRQAKFPRALARETEDC